MTDPTTPTLAERLRDAHERVEIVSLNPVSIEGAARIYGAWELLLAAADVLDAVHPRILQTAVDLAALGPLDDDWTADMNRIGNVEVKRDGALKAAVYPCADDCYRFRYSHTSLGDAVRAAIEWAS
jgi:hypothetical protein